MKLLHCAPSEQGILLAHVLSLLFSLGKNGLFSHRLVVEGKLCAGPVRGSYRK